MENKNNTHASLKKVEFATFKEKVIRNDLAYMEIHNTTKRPFSGYSLFGRAVKNYIKEWKMLVLKKDILVLFVLAGVFFTACSINDLWIEYVASAELTDTSQDKGQNISQPFQLYKSRMYMIGAEWIEEVDLKTKKKISQTRIKSGYFYIANDNIYFLDYLDYKDELCVSYCPLSDAENGKSEIYWNNISSMLIVDNKEMIGLRGGDEFCTLLKYDGKKEEVLFRFAAQIGDLKIEDLVGYYNGTYYFTDDSGKKIFKVDSAMERPEEIFSINEKKPYTFRILDVRYAAGHLYVRGTVIDTKTSDIAGPHYVKEAKNTGIWDISLEEEEIGMVSSVLYDDIYIFNGRLYGIFYGINKVCSWELLQ